MKFKVLLILMALAIGSACCADIYANFISGTVFNSDGSRAGSETNIYVRVESGIYDGTILKTNVDSKEVPPFVLGKGYFDTGDQLFFDNGASFTVEANNGTHYGTYSGTFVLGGNGVFETGDVKIILNNSLGTEVVPIEEDTGASGGSGSTGSAYQAVNGKVIKFVENKSAEDTALDEFNTPNYYYNVSEGVVSEAKDRNITMVKEESSSLPIVVPVLIIIILILIMVIVVAKKSWR